jgi:epsin
LKYFIICRFAQTVSGFGSSDSNDTTPTSPVFASAFGNHDGSGGGGGEAHARSSSSVNPDLEQARPQTVGEEELQLQLALAMSKEEAEQEEKKRRSDELRLQMALSQSEQEFQSPSKDTPALVDLLDVDLGGAAGLQAQASAVMLGKVDPWGSSASPAAGGGDPWSNSTTTSPVVVDPWSVPDGPNNLAGLCRIIVIFKLLLVVLI